MLGCVGIQLKIIWKRVVEGKGIRVETIGIEP